MRMTGAAPRIGVVQSVRVQMLRSAPRRIRCASLCRSRGSNDPICNNKNIRACQVNRRHTFFYCREQLIIRRRRPFWRWRWCNLATVLTYSLPFGVQWVHSIRIRLIHFRWFGEGGTNMSVCLRNERASKMNITRQRTVMGL